MRNMALSDSAALFHLLIERGLWIWWDRPLFSLVDPIYAEEISRLQKLFWQVGRELLGGYLRHF